jgi:hypothetical protein
VALSTLYGRRNRAELDAATAQIVALLREAQSRSVVQVSSTNWGVHFENGAATTPFYALFAGPVYATATRAGYYRLPPHVVYVSSTVPVGSAKDITFVQLSGVASASTSVGLYLVGGSAASSTIRVASSGAVGY